MVLERFPDVTYCGDPTDFDLMFPGFANRVMPLEAGESLDDALVREIREEVGVTPTQFRLIATVVERQPQIYGDALHHVYAVTAWEGGDPANVCAEHTELSTRRQTAVQNLAVCRDEEV